MIDQENHIIIALIIINICFDLSILWFVTWTTSSYSYDLYCVSQNFVSTIKQKGKYYVKKIKIKKI